MNNILIFAFISLLAFIPSINAGTPVTDPVSYTYYVQQIKQFTETVKSGKETVSSLGELKSNVSTMTSQFRGSYARALGLIGAVGELKNEVTTIPSALSGAGDSFVDLKSDYDGYNDIDANMSKAFNDPRSVSYNPDAYLTYQYNTKQMAKKNTIRAAVSSLEQQEQRIDNLENLAGQIDNTENIKDATDLNNRLLAEIIKGNLEILAILTRVAELEALEDYSGIEEDEANRQLEFDKQKAKGNDPRKFKFTNCDTFT